MNSKNSSRVQKAKKFLIISAFFALILAVPLVGGAATKKGSPNIYIGSDEKVLGNLIRAGSTVEINADVPQDLFVFGQTVLINGNVGGSVFTAASTVKINGDVAGSVRAAGSIVEINGRIGKNLTVFGSNVILGEQSEVGWDVVAYAATVELRGKINGRIDGGGSQIVVTGEVVQGGKVDVGKDGRLLLRDSAKVGGILEYVASEPAEVAPGAQIPGQLKQTMPKITAKETRWEFFRGPVWWFGKLIKLFGLLVVGLVLVSVGRKRVKAIADNMLSSPGKDILWGLVYFIAMPIALLLLLFTIIGVPLALIGAAVYAISLYVAKVFAGIALGGLLLARIDKKKKKNSLMLAMVIGLVMLTILCSLPFVGFLLGLLAMWWALGAMIEAKMVEIRKWR